MNTRAEATEGQAKIREALEREIESHADRLQMAVSSEFRADLTKRRENCQEALKQLSLLSSPQIVGAPQSSPAPSVIEAGDAMDEEEQFIAPHSGMWEFVGCVRIYLKEGDTLGVRAAKASRHSVTAPQRTVDVAAFKDALEKAIDNNPERNKIIGIATGLFTKHTSSLPAANPAAHGVTVEYTEEFSHDFDAEEINAMSVEAASLRWNEGTTQHRKCCEAMRSRLSALLTNTK